MKTNENQIDEYNVNWKSSGWRLKQKRILFKTELSSARLKPVGNFKIMFADFSCSKGRHETTSFNANATAGNIENASNS